MIASGIRPKREPSSVFKTCRGATWSCVNLLKSSFFLLVGLTLFGTSQPGWAGEAKNGDPDFSRPLRVMTQNLYVGTDITKVLPDPDNPNDPPVPVKVAQIFMEMLATNFPERAAAIADQIAAKGPDLIGLQEVVLVRTQSPGDFLLGNPQPATDLVFDFLEILLGQLAARGLDYRVAASVENADVELPMFAGFGGSPPGPLFDDARVTFRDVILVSGNVTIDDDNITSGNYGNNLEVVVGGIAIEFTRGFVIVDATVRGRSYRFANTHLESVDEGQAAFFQSAQAWELLETLNWMDATYGPLPTIIAGDLNSSHEDVVGPFGIVPPYLLMGSYQFEDAWLFRKKGPALGFTCCQATLLRNAESVLNERVDHIFVRLPGGLADTTVKAESIGDRIEDLTTTGMWPSDHAGVFVKMKIPGVGN